MALYAIDDDDIISAADAKPDKIYWCPNCFGAVKRRVGAKSFPHFYHLKSIPSCRLYSKSEDHLVGQAELSKMFPQGEIQIEKPFVNIGRVADACWEKEKIVFEIQCSNIGEIEIQARMNDYKSLGYDVIWLLDDQRFNKRICREAEQFLRERSCYFFTIKKAFVYDQFENFSEGKRIRKSKPFPINLKKIYWTRSWAFSEKIYPKQVVQLKMRRHFYGDRLSKTLFLPSVRKSEKEIEIKLTNTPNRIAAFLKESIVRPYKNWLENRIRGR